MMSGLQTFLRVFQSANMPPSSSLVNSDLGGPHRLLAAGRPGSHGLRLILEIQISLLLHTHEKSPVKTGAPEV
jgi:hypothetical protein